MSRETVPPRKTRRVGYAVMDFETGELVGNFLGSAIDIRPTKQRDQLGNPIYDILVTDRTEPAEHPSVTSTVLAGACVLYFINRQARVPTGTMGLTAPASTVAAPTSKARVWNKKRART